jgi:hypothetical protein
MLFLHFFQDGPIPEAPYYPVYAHLQEYLGAIAAPASFFENPQADAQLSVTLVVVPTQARGVLGWRYFGLGVIFENRPTLHL